MAAFFGNLRNVVIAGFVIAAVLYWVLLGVPWDAAYASFFFRWLHVLSGVMWIGLLWYFNFVQTPSMPKIPDEQKPAVTKVIAPTALFWFRWAAAATVVTGLILGGLNHFLVETLTLGLAGDAVRGHTALGIGMWFGLIMAFNVWVLIWPNQQKVLGLVEATADQKKEAARIAGIASRFNTMLSVPMLYAMVSAQNIYGLP